MPISLDQMRQTQSKAVLLSFRNAQVSKMCCETPRDPALPLSVLTLLCTLNTTRACALTNEGPAKSWDCVYGALPYTIVLAGWCHAGEYYRCTVKGVRQLGHTVVVRLASLSIVVVIVVVVACEAKR